MEIVADGLRFPEGPVAMADGSVILVEIAAGRITRVGPDGSKEIVAEPGGGPNGLADLRRFGGRTRDLPQPQHAAVGGGLPVRLG